jgi:hypothetical protein
MRYHSRYRIFREWQQKITATPNAQLYVVELAFGDRQFEVTDPQNPKHLQLRSSHNFWYKEPMINLGVRHLLPRNWKYVAWVDADVWFSNSDWALETIHQLQHDPVIQPWSEAVDLGPSGETLQLFQSFGQIITKGKKPQSKPTQPYSFGHPGYAWAATREFWEQASGVMDFAALGSADSHMAWAMYGHVDESYHVEMSAGFKKACNDWQAKVLPVTQGHVGFIPGTLSHVWHGSKKKRWYRERWQILVDNQFDPLVDLRYDAQGLPYIWNKPKLEREIGQYMAARDEDGSSPD